MNKIKLNAASADKIIADIEAGKEIDFSGIDIDASFCYVLVIWKTCHLDYKFKFPDEITKIIHTLASKKNGVTYTAIMKEVKDKFPKEDIQYILDAFIKVLQKHIGEWGFSFVNDYKMKLEQP